MCHQCNYKQMLSASNLDVTENRYKVLEVIGNNTYPLSAGDVFQTLKRNSSINKATVYRILDLLVKNGLLDRLSSFGRASYYGLAPNDHHRPHPHFFCKICGRVDCLTPDSLEIDISQLWKTFPGEIEKVETRVIGICKDCLKLVKAENCT